MIGVMSNTLSETRFRRLDDRSNPEYALLEKDRVGTFSPGEVSLLVPDVDEIHQMDNHTDRPTVEIHVYGRGPGGAGQVQVQCGDGQGDPLRQQEVRQRVGPKKALNKSERAARQPVILAKSLPRT